RSYSARGTNHIRYLHPAFPLRPTTDAPLRLVRDEPAFVLEHELHLVLGPDETLTQPVGDFVRQAEKRTCEYWREWVLSLALPLEWQEAEIRSAITLKLCQYHERSEEHTSELQSLENLV